MKKVLLLISVILCFALLFGCSSEDKTYDEKFLKDWKSGLMDRWDLAETTVLDSKENGEKLVSAELNKIEKYLTKKFEDSELQEKAIGYINCLKKQKEALKYFDADTEKYDKMWSEAYSQRAIYISDLISSYNIEFSDKYKSNVEDFTVKSKKIEEETELKKQIEEIKKNLDFKLVDQSWDMYTYEAVAENTTTKKFENFSVEISLLDSDDVIVESTYASVDNWAPGKKAKFEFMTDVKFESYEIEVDYYISE